MRTATHTPKRRPRTGQVAGDSIISEIRNPKPETRNPKPETRNPEPRTQNPKPETRNPELSTRNPNLCAMSLHDKNFTPTKFSTRMEHTSNHYIIWAVNFVAGEHSSQKITRMKSRKPALGARKPEQALVRLLGSVANPLTRRRTGRWWCNRTWRRNRPTCPPRTCPPRFPSNLI